MINMLWIGITGPMGSGKSTVAEVLRQMRFAVLDADDVARKVLSPGTTGEAKVLQTFGQHLKDKNGSLDRRALGRVVFGHPEKLAQLEDIIHPLVRDEVAKSKATLRTQGCAAAFYDVPLLFEKNMQKDFDHILVVSAPLELRKTRIQSRSQLTLEEIEERNSRHLPPAMKEKAASAVIHNSGALENLRQEILVALKKLAIPLPPATNS